MIRAIPAAIRAAVGAIRAHRSPRPHDADHHAVEPTWTRYGQHTNTAGAAWAEEAEQMLDDNARLNQAAMYAQGALVDRQWRWHKGRDTDIAIRNARYMNQMMGLADDGRLMERKLHTILEQSCRALDVGWSVSEVIYDTRYDSATGRWHTYVRDICHIRPNTVAGWVWAPDGRSVEFVSLTNGIKVPLAKCVHVKMRPQGEDPEGDLGRLFPCRRIHKAAMLYDDLIAVGGERWALQTPVVERDPSADHFYDPEQLRQMEDEAYRIASEYASGERNVLQQNRACRLGTYGGSSGFDPLSLVEVRRFLDDLGLAAYMAGALALGSSETGAKNVGEMLEGGMMTMLSAAGLSVGSAFDSRRRHERAVLRVLDLTFGTQDPRDYPELKPEGLSEERIARVMNVVPNWLAVDAPSRVPALWRQLAVFGGVDPDMAMEADAQATNARKRPVPAHLPNLDPSAGGLPARPTEA